MSYYKVVDDKIMSKGWTSVDDKLPKECIVVEVIFLSAVDKEKLIGKAKCKNNNWYWHHDTLCRDGVEVPIISWRYIEQ